MQRDAASLPCEAVGLPDNPKSARPPATGLLVAHRPLKNTVVLVSISYEDELKRHVGIASCGTSSA